MKDKIKNLVNKVPPVFRNRYILTVLVFFVWLILFDNNNLIDRFHYMKNMRQLEADREYYLNRIEEDSRKLKELKTDDENLEKFAREQYFMKKDNEDIYIITDENGKRLPGSKDD